MVQKASKPGFSEYRVQLLWHSFSVIPRDLDLDLDLSSLGLRVAC